MSNMLNGEKSPYLKAHACDPINWYTWGKTAFDKARSEVKPIFMCIGFADCHWCSLMGRESFRDMKTARILNENYVCILVDREERPDVDSVYMSVCSAVNGSGGWPLCVIMTAEQRPFFVSAYISKDDTNGQPGLNTLLSAIAAKWKSDRAALEKISYDISACIARKAAPVPAEPTADFAKRAFEQLSAAYDKEYGGFGTAPKFPSPQDLIFLMRYNAFTGNPEARAILDGTLKAMYKGGIFDHFGGGFSRYSTDREWLAPHFEKTLCDNALLAFVYTEAWQNGHLALYRYVAEATLDYCMRELLDENGGYLSGQSAESNGVEGGYYLFTPDEVNGVLGEEAGRHFCECYDITAEGNFHDRNIPNLLINTRWNLLPEGYDDYREKLRIYRAQRPLGTDNKILTAWNGLMLMALARAARAFSDARYLAAAQDLAGFMADNLYSGGRLKARMCEGELKFDAQLDDYVFYALGLCELYSAYYNPVHLSRALDLASEIISRFSDGNGGFYRTADDAERLIIRPQEIYDGAVPSGSSGAAVLFDTLYRLCGNAEMKQARDNLLKSICGYAQNAPAGCAFALCALLCAVYPTQELLCAAADDSIPEILKTVTARYSPELSVLLKTPSRAAALSSVAPSVESAAPIDAKPTFFILQNGEYGAGIVM